MKKLNVKKTDLAEVTVKWKFLPVLLFGKELFVRCNAKGIINWDKAPVYTSEELILKDNVSIL
jgi:hypothetical protein